MDTVGAIDLLGDRWMLHVLRAVSAGNQRFGELRQFTGAATDILTGRLNRLVEGGLLVRHPRSHGKRTRYEYELAKPGRDAMVILDAFEAWARRQSAAGAESEGRPASPTTDPLRSSSWMTAVDPEVRRRVSRFI
jgi:DNA-binding HxlR family transcriptional regulator